MTGGLVFQLDTSSLLHLAARFAAGGKDMPAAVARALNRTGDSARVQMTRELTAQTGLKRKVIVAALKSPKRAAAGSLFYAIGSHGGDIRLKYLGAKETSSGVSAAPWGERKVYPHTFMKGGLFPNRHGGPFGDKGHVYVRAYGGRFPLRVAKSGLFIPKEMVKGRTEEAFFAAVNTVLPGRLEHELARSLGAI